MNNSKDWRNWFDFGRVNFVSIQGGDGRNACRSGESTRTLRRDTLPGRPRPLTPPGDDFRVRLVHSGHAVSNRSETHLLSRSRFILFYFFFTFILIIQFSFHRHFLVSGSSRVLEAYSVNVDRFRPHLLIHFPIFYLLLFPRNQNPIRAVHFWWSIFSPGF